MGNGGWDASVDREPRPSASTEPSGPTWRSRGMGIDRILREKREDILRIAAKHGARNVRVFGSVARGEADEISDLDLLVEMEPGRSLLDHAALWVELREVLGVEVDVVSERGIKPRIRDRILGEAVPLCETPGGACWRCSTPSSGVIDTP